MTILAKDHDFPHFFAGKRLLQSEIPFPLTDFQQLLTEKLLKPVSSIRHNHFHLQCMRCGNKDPSLFGKMPCSSCMHEVLYCRKCIQMGRVMECEPLYEWIGPEVCWPKVKKPCTWEGELTPVQNKAAQRIVKAVHQGERQLLVWAVCGAGKTEMLFPGISEAIKKGKRVGIATPRVDVVRELLPRMEKAFRGISIQALFGDSNDKYGLTQMILATTHQLLRFKHAFDLLVIDEIDAFPFHADEMLPHAAKEAVKPAGTTIYLTATPRRQHHIQMIRRKLPYIFVPRRFHGHPLPIPRLKMCYFLQKQLTKYVPPMLLVKWIQNRRMAKKRQLLIFVPTIQLAEQLTKNRNKWLGNNVMGNLSIDFVHANDAMRAEKVTQFREKKIDLLFTTTILERGVTFPSVDVAVLDAGDDVFDVAALVQIAGRAGRSPDDPFGDVIFLHDGKTEAMVEAIGLIKSMNKRGGFNR